MDTPNAGTPEAKALRDIIRREVQEEIAGMIEDRASMKALRGTEAGRVLLGMAKTIRQIGERS